MIPMDFKGSNVVMGAPQGAENVQAIRAFKNEQVCITAWAFTADEIEEINRTGRVYLSVFFGGGMPPVFLGAESAVRSVAADYGTVFPKQDEVAQ